jgi:hypothetical protein
MEHEQKLGLKKQRRYQSGRGRARKTSFRMRTFGAIFQYVEEGAQLYEQWRARQQQQDQLARAEAAAAQREIDAYQRAEARFNRLSDAEYQALYERVKAELFERHAAALSKLDDDALDSAIKARVLSALLEEETEASARCFTNSP